MQEFGGQASQADGRVLAGGAGEQNRPYFCRTLLKPMENRLEKHPLKLDTPATIRLWLIRSCKSGMFSTRAFHVLLCTIAGVSDIVCALFFREEFSCM